MKRFVTLLALAALTAPLALVLKDPDRAIGSFSQGAYSHAHVEALLHRLGFYHFDQIANWTADEVAWVDQNLEGFRGRVSRDGWVAQARTLAAGGETEFSTRVKKGDVY